MRTLFGLDPVICSNIISAIGGVLVALIGVWGVWLTKRNRGERIKKDRDGTFKMPKPFPCASCNHEHVISLDDRCKVEFDFSVSEFVDRIPDFASVVYKFDPSVFVGRMKQLTFDILFSDGTFTGIDVEFKAADASRYSMWKKEIKRCKEWETVSIDLSCVDPQSILHNLNEICFVVKNSHFPDLECLSGSFEVKNVMFSDVPLKKARVLA